MNRKILVGTTFALPSELKLYIKFVKSNPYKLGELGDFRAECSGAKHYRLIVWGL